MSEESAIDDEIRAAITEVRREGQKAAFVQALTDAVLVTLAVAVAAGMLGVTETVSLPAAVASAAGITRLPVRFLWAGGLGVVVFVAEMAYTLRQPMVERFEAANPGVSEALRTARDAVDDGADTVMARELYADVLERLRDTSSLGLVDTRRLAVTVLFIVVLSVAGIQVTLSEFHLFGPADPGLPAQEQPAEYTGLQNGSAVLGEAENVSAGSEELEAGVGSTGEGNSDSDSTSGAYQTSGLGGGAGEVDAQQASYEASEEIEDAELIREYNIRIRTEE
jgi:hypothetical protein